MRRFERLAVDLKRAATEAGSLGQGLPSGGASGGDAGDVGRALRRLERKIGQAQAPAPAMSSTEFRALGKLEP